MNGSFLSLFVEIFVAILLIATIIYCFIVNRKLDKLRSDQKSLKAIIRDLNQSTLHAETAIGELRKTVDRAGQELSERIDYAEHLSTKLTKQNETSESLFNKLITVSRAAEKNAKATQMAPAPITPHDVTAAFQRSSQDFASSVERSNTVMQHPYTRGHNNQMQHMQNMQNMGNVNSAMPQAHANTQMPNVQQPTNYGQVQNTKDKPFPRLSLKALAQRGLPKVP